MKQKTLEEPYHQYLLDFMRIPFDEMIETEIMNLEEFRMYIVKTRLEQ